MLMMMKVMMIFLVLIFKVKKVVVKTVLPPFARIGVTRHFDCLQVYAAEEQFTR